MGLFLSEQTDQLVLLSAKMMVLLKSLQLEWILDNRFRGDPLVPLGSLNTSSYFNKQVGL